MINISYRRMTCAVACCVAGIAVPGCSGSADPGTYPEEQNVTVVVPYETGGPNDVSARAVGPCLEDELDASIVIENRPGGGGIVGLKQVADGEADGYTLGITSVSTAVVAPMQSGGAGYSHEDFSPVGLLAVTPSLLVAANDSPHDDAEEFFAKAEESPESITVGIPADFYEAELRRMEELYDVAFNIVPFDGTSPTIAALRGGNVEAMFGAADTATMEQVNAGEFRPLATGAEEAVQYLPNVPTLVSLGYDELTLSDSVIAVSAPNGTPDEVLDTLSAGIEACLDSEQMVESLGEEYIPDDFVGQQEVEELFEDSDEAFAQILGN